MIPGIVIVAGMAILFFLCYTIVLESVQKHAYRRKTKEFELIKKSNPPKPPEPEYICANCGMFIKSTHRHTQTECEAYQADPTKPDGRAHRTIMPHRNAPQIRLPYYSKEAGV